MLFHTVIPFVEVALGFLVVFIVPGYLLGTILIPRRMTVSLPESLGLSMGVGLAFAIMVGTILLLLGFRKPADVPWIILATVLIVWLLCRAVSGQFGHLFSGVRMLASQGARRMTPWLLMAVLVCAGGGLGTLVSPSHPSTVEQCTEFYVLDSQGGLPRRLSPDSHLSQTIRIGIASHEQRPTQFAIVVRVGGAVKESIGPINIEDGEIWEGDYALQPLDTSELSVPRVSFELRKGNTVYRTVFLAVDP